MNLSLFIFTFTVLFFDSYSEKFSFEGYQLLRITPKNANQIRLLDIWEDNPDFDVWNGIKTIDEPVDVLLSPDSFKVYKPLLILANMPFVVIDKNIQLKIDEQEKSMKNRALSKSIIGKYARYSEVTLVLLTITEENRDIASYYSAGKTYENRDLRVIVLKTANSRKSVWIDCGIHSREWVSPATCIWFIDRLIKDYKNSDSIAIDLLNYYEFHILPLVNPDGYEYTHNTFRLWRKNRRPNSDLGSSCIGTDLNRNYGYKWLVSGASNNPCSDTYAGRAPDSELETIAIEKAINTKKGNWHAFITLHSYGNFWMVPYGFGTQLPPDYSDLIRISKIGADALKSVYGTQYSIGSPANLLYSAAGGSFDWTYAIAGIKYSIALELRPGQTGQDSNYGFTLPEDRVPLVGEETYVGLKAMIRAIKNEQ